MSEWGYRMDPGGWKVRWNERLARLARERGDWLDLTVAEASRDAARRAPDRVLLVDGEREVTTGEIWEQARALAGWFREQGLVAGDVVSFQLPNWWEAAVVNIAAAALGLVANPIVPINRDAEVLHMLNAASSRVMFVPGQFRSFDYLAMMDRLASRLDAPPVTVLVRAQAPGRLSLAAITQDAVPIADVVPVNPDAVKLLMYTSGTTGTPKGVLHSHNTINADAVKMRAALALTADDRTFSPSPVTHVSGYLWALNMPFVGDVPAVMLDVWEPTKALDLMRRHGCTFSVGATPFLRELLAVAQQEGERLPALCNYMCGGASVPPSLIYAAAEQFSHCIPWRTFGATEAPTMTCGPASRSRLKEAAETDGRLHGAEVKIVDLDTGLPVAAEAEGEILVREPSMALGYASWADTVEAYDADGFFRMGDLGRLVAGELLICTGRKKDLIIRAGENISAKEIEDVLMQAPAIAEVAVVSMPSARTGEAICAFVIPANGAEVALTDLAKLIAEAGLAKQKTPEHIELMDDLPRTASGKVKKDALRELARAKASAL